MANNPPRTSVPVLGYQIALGSDDQDKAAKDPPEYSHCMKHLVVQNKWMLWHQAWIQACPIWAGRGNLQNQLSIFRKDRWSIIHVVGTRVSHVLVRNPEAHPVTSNVRIAKISVIQVAPQHQTLFWRRLNAQSADLTSVDDKGNIVTQ